MLSLLASASLGEQDTLAAEMADDAAQFNNDEEFIRMLGAAGLAWLWSAEVPEDIM